MNLSSRHAVLGTLFALLPCLTLASSPPATTPNEETLLIVGEQPGPGMWKVQKGGNTLWLIGTYSPVPEKMKWRAKGIREVVANSQEVLSAPSVSISTKQIGIFRAITLIPSAMEARRNPDGAVLKDLVPPDVYRRWLALRDKYIEENNTNDEAQDIERWRPMFAALELYDKAIRKHGMTQQSPVWKTVQDTARQQKVKVTDVNAEPNISNPGTAIRELNRTRLADLDCFSRTIERIETELTDMKKRANAWARGDVAALKNQLAEDQRAACNAAVRDAAFVKTLGLGDITTQMEAAWLVAAEMALATNASTVAVLPITQITGAKGYLAKLAAKGYTVTEPDE